MALKISFISKSESDFKDTNISTTKKISAKTLNKLKKCLQKKTKYNIMLSTLALHSLRNESKYNLFLFFSGNYVIDVIEERNTSVRI